MVDTYTLEITSQSRDFVTTAPTHTFLVSQDYVRTDGPHSWQIVPPRNWPEWAVFFGLTAPLTDPSIFGGFNRTRVRGPKRPR